MLNSDPAKTAQRVRDLSMYLGRDVMTPGCHDSTGFVCKSFADCQSSISNPVVDFHAGQMSHVGEHYDLIDDGHDLRIVVVGQESGTDKPYVDLADRRQQIVTASGWNLRYSRSEGPIRNPHMRGTTSALRYVLGVEGDSHASEFLDLASGERVHMFDAFSLVNVLLCSAHEKGKRGRSTTRMRKNCFTHFKNTLQLLEPNVLVIQGLGVWKWIRGIFEGPGDRITENLVRMRLNGNDVYIATFTHPSMRGDRQWGRGNAPPYLVQTVAPALKRVRAEIRNDRERLAPMRRFMGLFDDPNSAGEWGGGNQIAPNTVSMPFFVLSDAAGEFADACYEHHWVLGGQDWIPWASDAEDLAEHPTRFETADIDQISRCLTVYLRADRFSEGTLAHCFQTGAIAAIVRRMKTLADELS